MPWGDSFTNIGIPQPMPVLRQVRPHLQTLGCNRRPSKRSTEYIDNRSKFLLYRCVSDTPNRIPYITYTFRMALIFRGSCVPLSSSPRTKGTISPDLALLICG